MNIFVLDLNPKEAARQMADQHIRKMALESAQLLCGAFEEGVAPYKRSHYNHPCAKWARATRQNYEWLIEHGFEICEEFVRRFHPTADVYHSSEEVIEWCYDNYLKLHLPSVGLTNFAQAMPSQFWRQSPTAAYREYYRTNKREFKTPNGIERASWTNRAVPDWWR